MRLIDLLDRCLTLEKRAAAVYRTFEASPSGDAQLWAELAADEEAHARSIREAEHLPAAAGQDRRLIAALNIELSEIEVLRRLAIGAVGHPRVPDQDHA